MPGGHGLVILQSTPMRETRAADQAVEGKGFEGVGHRRGVRAGAWPGAACGKLGDHPAVVQNMIPRYQSAIRGERLVAASQMKLSARRQEFEIQFSTCLGAFGAC